MKLAMLFGILCVACLLLYGTLFALVINYPAMATGLSAFMMLSGWGAGAFFILAIVMLVLRR